MNVPYYNPYPQFYGQPMPDQLAQLRQGVFQPPQQQMSEFLETMKSADSGHAWRVLDEFMDALKEAKPETYAGLMHDLKRTK